MIYDWIFYILSTIFICLGLNSVTGIMHINDSHFLLIIYILIVIIYFIAWYKHQKNQAKRFEDGIHKGVNDTIDRIKLINKIEDERTSEEEKTYLQKIHLYKYIEPNETMENYVVKAYEEWLKQNKKS